MRFGERRIAAWITLALAVAVLAGCEGAEYTGSGRPIVFPEYALLGETIVMVVGSNAIPVWVGSERYDLSVQNVKIRLTDTQGNIAPLIVPRSVFDAPASISGRMAATAGNEGASLTLAVFELPATAWAGFSGTGPVAVDVMVNGVPDGLFGNEITIEGSGGFPMNFGQFNEIEGFGPRPMIRLQPFWELASSTGFDPAWAQNMGSIEFTLSYNSYRISAPEAFAQGDAATGFALAGPESSLGPLMRSVKVVLAVPKGFSFIDYGCIDVENSLDCNVGQGPFMDIAFTKHSENYTVGELIFGSAQFVIDDLRVYDIDGNALPPGSTAPLTASEYLTVIPVNNLAEAVAGP